MSDDRISVDAGTVRQLIEAQFPQWSGLPVRPVARPGWDNHSFRLGEELKVRLPSAARYVSQIAKENRWLPELAPHLPVAIPKPVAIGEPDDLYPWPWAVQRWLEGATVSADALADRGPFARDLAGFLLALDAIDAGQGPQAGAHNFFRGGPLHVYDEETHRTADALCGQIDIDAAIAAWQAALAAPWQGRPVWVHGDIAVGNLLLREGRLAAVIDFGSSGVGDPACDLIIAWTFFDGKERAAFREAMARDRATWARARGWALWKALLVLANGSPIHPAERPPRRVIEDVIAEHRHLTG